MAPQRELIVSEHPIEAALTLILELQPRTWALSGGSTPRPLYERLVGADLPWRDIDLFWGDERCVPPDHPDSNYRLVEDALLSSTDAPIRVHRMPGESCDAEAYEALLRERLGPEPRLDLALMGIGADGHTASLFPGDAALEERDRLVLRVERPDHPRLTLTLPVLSRSAVALFLVTGASKRIALSRLLAGDEAIPAARVAASRVVVVADPAAAGR